jgi:hypothetical protein
MATPPACHDEPIPGLGAVDTTPVLVPDRLVAVSVQQLGVVGLAETAWA